MQTSGVSLNPDYQYLANRPPRIKGYYASNTVNVTVRDIGRLGGIPDALVATGANQLNGPTFDIEDKDAVLDEARAKAFAKTRARAEGYPRRLVFASGASSALMKLAGAALRPLHTHAQPRRRRPPPTPAHRSRRARTS